MIYELAYRLNEELLKDDIILLVKEKEMIMNNSHDFMRLVIAYETLKSEIDDLEKYGLSVEDKKKELFNVKYKLDTLDVVKEYKEAYSKAKEYLREIANEVFKDIDEELKINRII